MSLPLTPVSVTVDDGHLAQVETVAQALRDSGMQVERVLGSLGLITGRAPAGARPSLLAVEGVTSVDEQLRFSLPPPDAPVQ
ncbi:hypothetical protein SAMN05660464_2687 [Geodermatophilus dictyosporus]|uniref:Ketohydroxyglutarate aldolase n=1 Tax=Geodermatophilus dictyosporus TaxID=1523247 RepID=A0A1I5NTN9_9ACTN|nr:hypothetical protein [Geodermatophilus dictyosporus]SFP25142.1 hypothetical protein SAMN05660464_2687 [Geodermatophilus dictyosporus]